MEAVDLAKFSRECIQIQASEVISKTYDDPSLYLLCMSYYSYDRASMFICNVGELVAVKVISKQSFREVDDADRVFMEIQAC